MYSFCAERLLTNFSNFFLGGGGGGGNRTIWREAHPAGLYVDKPLMYIVATHNNRVATQ